MLVDNLKISIGSKTIQAEEISITKTIDAICDSFMFKMPFTQLPINEQVHASVNHHNLMVGYVDNIVHATPANNNTITLSGRSKSQDIVDSRITHTAKDITLADLSLELFAKFGQSFTTKIKTEIIKDFSIVAESAFESLNQIAKQQNLLFIENVNGSVSLVKPANVDNLHIFLGAENLSNFNLTENISVLFGNNTVKVNPTKDNLSGGDHKNYSFTLKNENVRDSRVLEVIADSLITDQACKDRAVELSTLAKAQSIGATGTASDWFAPDGNLWQPNSTYTIADEQLLLASATFKQSASNRTTELKFKGHYVG